MFIDKQKKKKQTKVGSKIILFTALCKRNINNFQKKMSIFYNKNAIHAKVKDASAS